MQHRTFPTNFVPLEAKHVYLIEDDIGILKIMSSILIHRGYIVYTYKTAEDFLFVREIAVPATLVVDIHLTGASGIDLQSELLRRGYEIPVVFISGQCDVHQTVQAFRQGAIELLIKPFETSHLIDAVERGIHRDYREVMRFLKKEKLESNLKKLTKRERELYDLLIKAFNNKELVTATGLALNTVKDYKTNVMQKMQVSTVSELIKISGVD